MSSVYAQLKVDSVGNVLIGDESLYNSENHQPKIGVTADKTAIQAEVLCTSPSYHYGIYSYAHTGADCHATTKRVGVYGRARSIAHSGRSYGVLGTALGRGNGWNFGVAGCLHGTSEYLGTGIYGTCGNYGESGIEIDGRYAGFFNGNVKTLGDLTVSGSISATLLGAPASNEVTGNEEIDTEDFSQRLALLSVSSYHRDVSDYMIQAEQAGNDTINEIPNVSCIERQSCERIHYGLQIEQLKESFPELVYEQEDGTQGVNYMELIPILVQTINEQNKRIEALEGNAPKKAKAQKTTAELGSAKTITTDVKQIKYSLPADAKNAELMLCDASGKMIRKMDLEGGKADVKLNTSDLPAGIYLYSLVSGGKVMETKKMVVKH